MPTNASTIAQRLKRARGRLFIGREAEKQLFDYLIAPHSDLRVLFLNGTGGVGKTTLLQELQTIAQARSLPVIWLDGRGLMPSPQAVEGAINAARSKTGIEPQSPHLLVIDTFEQLTALEGWVREQWLPNQSDNVRVVLAGRQPPSMAWRTDPGWSQALSHRELPYFEPSQAQTYLSRRDLTPDAIGRGVTFAQGHPLALALYADAARAMDADAPPASDLLLLQMVARVLDNAATRSNRLALYACAVVHSINEALLSAMLKQDAGEQIDWLRSLSFMQQGARGLFPHDLIRDALLVDLKQRDSDLYQRLGERAFNWSLAQLEAGQGDALAHGLDLFYQLREMQPPAQEAVYLDSASQADWHAIEAMLLKHETRQSFDTLRLLAEAQPQALRVARNAEQTVIGFMLMLALNELPEDVMAQDALTALFWHQCNAGKAGRVSLLRFWMHRDAYMDLSPVHPLAFTAMMLDSLTPGQAYGGLLQPDNDFWAAQAKTIGHQRMEESQQTLPRGDSVLVYQDFTQRSAAQWLRGIYRRFQDSTPVPAPQAPAPVADRDAFICSVRTALKHYPRADLLARNDLLHSRQVREKADSDDTAARIAALRTVIDEACASLANNAKTRPHARALQHGYLTPAANQHLAADAANVAYSTFRRHLAEAVRMIAAQLWECE